MMRHKSGLDLHHLQNHSEQYSKHTDYTVCTGSEGT